MKGSADSLHVAHGRGFLVLAASSKVVPCACLAAGSHLDSSASYGACSRNIAGDAGGPSTEGGTTANCMTPWRGTVLLRLGIEPSYINGSRNCLCSAIGRARIWSYASALAPRVNAARRGAAPWPSREARGPLTHIYMNSNAEPLRPGGQHRAGPERPPPYTQGQRARRGRGAPPLPGGRHLTQNEPDRAGADNKDGSPTNAQNNKQARS